MRPLRKMSRTTRPPAAPMIVEAPASPAATLTQELIAARAYEIWERRGCRAGESERDWYAARRELELERLGWAAPADGDRDLRP
jgi:Protein of unknown function (DUF2934)